MVETKQNNKERVMKPWLTIPQDLIPGLLRKDDISWAHVVTEENSLKLGGEIYRVLGGSLPLEDCLDAAQESWITAYFNISDLDAEKIKLPSWILTIGLNRARDSLRRKTRHRETSADLLENRLGQFIYGTSPSAEKEALSRETTRDLNDALGELPVDQRLIFILKHVINSRDRLIIDEVGVSRTTIFRRLMKAKKTLRDIMHNKGYQE